MNTLLDTFGRTIDYLRLSVTDRCDFRCLYCMAENMTFLPRSEVLSLEELVRLAKVFVSLGVKKIRLTGGEPLIRRDAMHLIEEMGKIDALEELCLSTNGAQLDNLAEPLFRAGVKRINISLDSLLDHRFKRLTRHGDVKKVLAGIEATRQFAFNKVKINAVMMRNFNLDEATSLARYALERDLDISFIEEMPLGEIASHARNIEFVSSAELRDILSGAFTLNQCDDSTGGPSRYWKVAGYSGRLGFISPHSENFCSSCNRVRVTAAGRLLLCLGNEHSVDLKQVLRQYSDDTAVRDTIIEAMAIKPEKHEFNLDAAPQVLRFMNATGG